MRWNGRISVVLAALSAITFNAHMAYAQGVGAGNPARDPRGQPGNQPREPRAQPGNQPRNPQSQPGNQPQDRTLRPISAVSAFTDEDIEKKIQELSESIFKLQLPNGSWPNHVGQGPGNEWPTGPTAIAVYALIESGVKVDDPRIAKALEWLTKNYESDNRTYSVALRCNAWLAANKQTKKQYQKHIEKDVALLVRTGEHFGGGAPYDALVDAPPRGVPKNEPGTQGDNSNSQYLLLGVWAGARSGIEVPKQFWETCMQHWIKRQFPDGGWNYNPANTVDLSYGSMSTAGLASIFVCIDATMGDKFIKCNVSSEYAPVKKGLDWFSANFEKTLTEPWNGHDRYYFGYYMYGIERVGLASGYKYFGKCDWYKEGCKRILGDKDMRSDIPAGRESVLVAGYSYKLLFLSRGRRPVLFNRLEYDGDWNNRPRALANFCRWAENTYEHEVNWQIVTLKSEVGEWHDAPVVLITGSKAPKFSDEDLAKLRAYVEQGGTILSITECNGAPFGTGMKNLYKKLFPKYELANLGRDHPLYKSHYKLPGTPAISAVSNGIRPLAIHIDSDLPLSWQTYSVATAKGNFEAGANLLSYVTDKELYNRGAKVWPDAATAPNQVKAARIRYGGNYDPEPLTLERLSRLMAKTYKVQIDYASPLAASAPASQSATPAIPVTGIPATQLTGDIKLAFLTGTGAFKLPDDEKDALKKWSDAGGLLIADAAGGNKAFTDSAKELVADLYGPDALLSIPLSNPVYQFKDLTVDKVKYRPATRARTGGITEPCLMAVLADDKPKFILSAEDLTAGLVGYSSWGLDGYSPQSAFEILRNIILYVSAGKSAASPAVEPSSPSTAPAKSTPTPTTAPAGDAIDWQRAMELYKKETKGETLAPDEKAYLERAKKARAANPGGNSPPVQPPDR